MGKVQDKMCEDLRLRGLAENTQEAYQRAARGFVAFHMRPADELGTPEVRQYLLILLDVARRNPTTINLVISALRFLYGTTLGRPEVMQPVHSVIKHQPLPILSRPGVGGGLPPGADPASGLALGAGAAGVAVFVAAARVCWYSRSCASPQRRPGGWGGTTRGRQGEAGAKTPA